MSAALQAFRSQRDVTAELQPALAERRARAFERFEEQGLPTTKHEDWRFTSLRPLLDVAFAARAADFAPDAGILDRAHQMVGNASRWVTVNGVHHADLSTPQGCNALVLVTEWNEFRVLDFDRLRDAVKEPVFVDCRNVYKPDHVTTHGFRYSSFGRGR